MVTCVIHLCGYFIEALGLLHMCRPSPQCVHHRIYVQEPQNNAQILSRQIFWMRGNKFYLGMPAVMVAKTPVFSGLVPLRKTFKDRPSVICLNIQGQVNPKHCFPSKPKLVDAKTKQIR